MTRSREKIAAFVLPVLLTVLSNPQMTDGAFLPGKILLVEDHSQLIAECAKNHLKNQTVLHIDAHDDLWPPPSDASIEAVNSLIASGKYPELDASGRYDTPWEKTLFNINNYLVVGHRVGIVRNVYWAIPVFDSLDHAGLSALKQSLSNGRRFSPEEVGRLKIEGPHLTGTLSGVPITIGSLKDFPRQKNPVLLSIDLDFFPPLYKNPVASTFRGILAGFAGALRSKLSDPTSLILISYSHNGGHLPISFRFLGDWLRQLLADPTLLESEPPKRWLLKEEARYLEFFLQDADAENVYRRLLSLAPKDPDNYYCLGMNLLSQGRLEEGLDALAHAFRLDRAYILGFLDAAGVVERGSAPDKLLEVLLRAETLDPEDPIVLDTLGRFHYNRGEYGESIRYYRKLVNLGKPSPLAHAYLGDSYRKSGLLPRAEKEYREALLLHRKHPDTEIPPVYWRILGEVQEAMNKPVEALETYRQFLRLSEPPPRPEDLRHVKERVTALESNENSKRNR